MGERLDPVFALITIGAFFLVAFVLVKAVRSLASRASETVEVVDRPRRCEHCDLTATKYVPLIVETSWFQRMLGFPKYRRSAATWHSPAYCELHGLVAESAIDVFLQQERLNAEKDEEDRARRVASFQKRVLSGSPRELGNARDAPRLPGEER